ncbi:MAG: NADH-quinone oxidoreductase subunit A [Euryarchaeota archaeon]|nr:NADH-quinone oxidoreductase subunit A [Euryarchaeota archaeon]
MASLFDAYMPVVILGVVSTLLIFVTIFAPKVLQPWKPNRIKALPYECGEVPIGSNRGPMNVQYYLYIINFLILDVEAMFLLPWAMRFTELGTHGLVVIGIFVATLLFAWFYALKNGELEWVK